MSSCPLDDAAHTIPGQIPGRWASIRDDGVTVELMAGNGRHCVFVPMEPRHLLALGADCLEAARRHLRRAELAAEKARRVPPPPGVFK